MNIKKSPSKKRKPLIRVLTVIAVVILLAVAGYVLVTSMMDKKSDVQTTDTQTTPDSTITPQTDSDIHTTDGNTKADDAATNEEPATSPPITITASTQNGDVYQIRVLISTITNSGDCTVSFERSGYATVTKTVGVQAGPSSTTCKGFDVSTSELAPGEWSARISFKNDSQSAETTQAVTVK